MQFAGQRTDMALRPVGDPVDMLVKLTPDVLPDPDAILVTGITPQQTIADGITEAEFLKNFDKEVATPGTIFVGFNTVRFDDEFMRFTLYRNFYDPYEWQWKDDRSRWDLLDVVRMTRALRPDGIKWPFASDGSPTNRLELITSLNKIDHFGAHNALVDVKATIAVANLIREKQPKLFDFLLTMRNKKKVEPLVQSGQPFVYSSGKYPSKFEKTTVAIAIAKHPKKQGALVYDLRHDPTEFAKLDAKQLVQRWAYTRDENAPVRLPVKTLQYNRCPAVAPLSVLDDASKERLALNMKTIEANRQKLSKFPEFVENILKAVELMDKKQQSELVASDQDVDSQLYDDFIDNADKNVMRAIRAAEPDELLGFAATVKDKRLQALLPLYKARNYPGKLSGEEREQWEQFCAQRLLGGGQASRMAKYFARLQEIAARPGVTQNQQYLLEELKLYGESIMPVQED